MPSKVPVESSSGDQQKIKAGYEKTEIYHLGIKRSVGTRKNALQYATIMLNLVYEVNLKRKLQLGAKQPAEISNRFFFALGVRYHKTID